MACNPTINCTCTYFMFRHGKCCECVHIPSGEVPGCFFSKSGNTYDRSIENLYSDYKNNR